MDTEFASIWNAVGWLTFAEISKEGSRNLTIQFLCTLVETENGVSFRFFGNEFVLSWRDLRTILDFHQRWTTNVGQATRGYHKESFWHSISRLNTYSQPRCNDIQHPTLHLMHKWLALTCFPREDVQTVRVDELHILYAMVNKIKIAPVQEMVHQWLGNFRMSGPVECTSLVTRIATSGNQA